MEITRVQLHEIACDKYNVYFGLIALNLPANIKRRYHAAAVAEQEILLSVARNCSGDTFKLEKTIARHIVRIEGTMRGLIQAGINEKMESSGHLTKP